VEELNVVTKLSLLALSGQLQLRLWMLAIYLRNHILQHVIESTNAAAID
jgi:hypothetical protein